MPPTTESKAQTLTRESELILTFFKGVARGCFVDVGANEPKKDSQTWPLEERGWSGVLVEPLPHLAEKLRAERPRSRVFEVACSAPGHRPQATFYVSDRPSKSSLGKNAVASETEYVDALEVELMTLDEVLAAAGNPKIDFVSIDVEGFQLLVVQGFSLQRHRPALVLVEDHLYSLATHREFKRQGYKLVKRTGSNNWYIPNGEAFAFTGTGERLKLWKKVYANTPFRKLRVWWEYVRVGKKRTVSA